MDTKKLIESNRGSEKIISLLTEVSVDELRNHQWNLTYVEEDGYFLKDEYKGYTLLVGWGWHNMEFYVLLENYNNGDQIIIEDFTSLKDALQFAERNLRIQYNPNDVRKIEDNI